MGKRSKFGICHICGANGQLSFEHVPPRSAFNDKPIVQYVGERVLTTHPEELRGRSGPVSQKGAGNYTLCVPCNTQTGAWYGDAYASWVYQGLHLSEHAQRAPALYHLFHIFPLRVIKQILCMFFSANSPFFRQKHEDLIRLVLNKEQKYIRDTVQIYAYFNISPVSRQSAVTGLVNLNEQGHKVFSEISFPPFGYIASFNSPVVDERLVNITHFVNYSYNEFTDVSLKLPVLPVYTAFPGDFRDKDQVLTEMMRSESNQDE